ncbi:hypothetical protein LSAT2_017071 [Lamellibrachia satsuma]|nr:hypothetical protein LSAT2_017071 [Lamellibrachia satsuma]
MPADGAQHVKEYNIAHALHYILKGRTTTEQEANTYSWSGRTQFHLYRKQRYRCSVDLAINKMKTHIMMALLHVLMATVAVTSTAAGVKFGLCFAQCLEKYRNCLERCEPVDCEEFQNMCIRRALSRHHYSDLRLEVGISSQTDAASQPSHHEDKPGTQATLIKYVKFLIMAMKEMGNHFWDTNGGLLVFDTRVVAEVTVVDSVIKMKKFGEDKRKEFFKKRLVDSTNTVNETIPKNKLRLFSLHLEKRKSPAQQQLLSLKRDRNLFSTLYIIC